MHNGIHPNVFENYPNSHWVETGSNLGLGIDEALEAGFPNIYSIELSKELYMICCRKFKDNHNVRIYHGDSAEKLWEVIKDINEPITFWLDGHYCGGCYYEGREIISANESPTPLEWELRAIAKHPIKTHTILIDNYSHFFGINIGRRLWEINKLYKLSLINGTYKNDIVLAKL